MSQPTEIHTLAGAYALDALSEIERASFARHVADCPSCAIEVAELSESASRLSAASWSPPPSGLRAAVLAEVARTRQVTASPRVRGGSGDTQRWRRWMAASVAAGVVAIGGVTGVWAVQQSRIDDLRQQAQQLRVDQARVDSVLAAGDARVVSTDLPGGGRMIVAVSRSRNDGVVLMSDVPAPPAGKAYQLWLISGTAPTSIGVMPPGIGTGTAPVSAIGAADKIAVTIEPAGGSPAPTTTPIAAVTLT
jgi:anti-sigma-K factor RskA